MEENKDQRKYGTVSLIFIIIIALLCTIIYFGYIKKDNITEEENGNETIEEVPTSKEELHDPILYDELIKKYEKYNPSYALINNEPREIIISPFEDVYKFVLTTDGQLNVSKNDSAPVTVSNISNAIGIDYINDISGYVFILLSNGDIYEYMVDDINNQNYEAIKIEGLSNAVQFVEFSYNRCIECESISFLGVIDKDNYFIKLDSVSFDGSLSR